MSRSILGGRLHPFAGHQPRTSWTIRTRVLFIGLAALVSWAILVVSFLMARQ
jgi:hypothetical protein